MSTFAEYTNKKKKKKQSAANTTFGEYTRSILGDVFEEEDTKSKKSIRDKYDFEDDIAPVVNTKDKEEEKRTWFQKGAFSDGYNFGDVTKTVFGTVRDVEQNITAGVLGIGEKAVDAGAYVVGGVGGIVSDKFRDNMKDFIAKDLYNEEEIAKHIQFNGASWLADLLIKEEADKTSVLGEKSDSLAQSAGQLAGTAGLQAVGVPWWATTGVTSFGGEADSAFKQGATYGEAGVSGAITAASDIATEMLFKGSGLGEKGLINTSGLTKNLSNQVVKTFADYGITIASEAAEEVIAGMISNAGTAAYKDESLKDLVFSKEAMEGYLESAIGGGLLGGGMNAGKFANSLNTNRDFNTGLTTNEQKVVDAEIESRVAEKEADGTKLDKKARAEIEEQVLTDLKKGAISIDSIEKTLGGDTYKSYQSIIEQENPLKRELEEVKNNRTLTKKQRKTLVNAIESELKTLGETSNKTQLKEQLSKEVDTLTQNDTFLRESYNEKGRRSQAFEADLTKYDAKQQAVVKKAAESGILNNTRRTHEFVDMVAKISADKGVSFDFTNNAKLKESGFAIDGKTVNGYVKDGNIALNIESNKALNTVVGHEITHVLEGTELYTELQQAVKDYATTKGEYDTRLQELTKLYKGVENANIEAELTADLVGEYLFTDSDFVSKLSTEKPNIFKKIYEEIKYLVKTVTGSKEFRELEKVKRAFDKAYKENAQATKDTKYSASEDTNLYQYVQDALSGKLPKKSYYKISDTISDRMAKDIENIVGFSVKGYGNEISPGSIRHINKEHGENGRTDHSMKDYHDLAKVSYVIDNYDNIKEGKRSEEFKNSDGTYAKTVELQKKIDDGFYYVVEAVPDAKNKTLHIVSAYINKKDTFSDVLVSNDPKRYVQDEHQPNVSLNNSIPQNDKNASSEVKYSLTSDTEGRTLSKEQQEYFKDSKIRDDNGNLKVMYHGSPESFTVFDKKKAKSSGYYGKGFYFTDSTSHAGQYGSTYEVYLNITNPIQDGTRDITKEQLRRFVDAVAADEDYGIENYGYGATVDSVTDSVYGKDDFRMIADINATSIGDMVAAVELFNEVNGTDYNGIIVPTETVAFYPNQIKNVDNAGPTSDADIRFSLSESVEQTKDLFAIHNLQASELVKSIGLGGLPMPSIAIIKDQQSHEQYGDVSLIFSKDAIDPKATKNNKVYGGDAWTPTYPKIEYKPNDKVAEKIRDKYYELGGEIGYDAVRPMYRYISELENALNRDGGESGMLEKLYDDTGMMQVYLEDSGKGRVEPVINETRTEASEAEKEQNQYFLDNERDLVNSYKQLKAQVGSPMTWLKEHLEEVEVAYKKYLKNQFEFTDAEIDNVLANTKKVELTKLFREAVRYEETGGVTVKTETDYEATNAAIKKKAESGYKNWADNLFKGVEEKSGIRNNADYYTNSGNPRSWNALHWENTLENVVKAMKGQDQTGADAMSPIASIFAVAQKEYGSIAEIKADSDRLGKVTEEEYESLKESYSNRLTQIASSIMDTNARNSFIEMDSAAELIIDAIRTQKTKSAMLTYMKKWNKRVTGETVDDIVSLVSDISNMPTGYFEAKPQRAVGLDEVGVFVIPYNADAKLKQELLNRGYSIAEYDPNIEGDRQRVVNQFEEYKFSLSNVGQAASHTGNYNVYGKDIALETPQDVAPVSETVTEVPVQNVADDFAPLTEEQADERDMQQAPIDESYLPAEVEDFDDIFGGNTTEEVADPFYERDIKDVGKRNVKAYMYENPEVKPYFQEEAHNMLYELQNSVKGEKSFNDQLYYETGGEQGWYGTKRETSEDIAYLLDNFKYTYADIEKGLKAIIEDHGAENNAISKRIEFALNDRLKDGYTDFQSGMHIPANQDYVQLLTDKQISAYSDEAYNQWVQSLAAAEPTPEMAPVRMDAVAQPSVSEDIAPVSGEMLDGKQRVMDFETGQIVDEAVSELDKAKQRVNRKLEVDKRKAFEAFKEKQSQAFAELGDRNTYISTKAFELYNELKDLKKGVRASRELGYLLDHGYPWNDVKTALLNTRAKPDRMVNANSGIEAIVRESIGRDYDSKYENISYMDMDYAEQVKKMEADAEAEIKALETGEREPGKKTHGEIQRTYVEKIKQKFSESGLDFDKILEKAKNKSTFASVDNTPQRYIEKTLGYKEGQILNDLTVNKEALNESKGIAWLNSFTNRKDGELAKLSKKYGIKPNSKEDAAAQMYAEGFYVDDNNNFIRYGDAELAKDFPNKKTQQRIKELVNNPRVREIYDSTLEQINESRVRNGYPEIPRRNNYYLHFRAMDDTFSKLGIPFNPNDIRAKDLPTDINGMTADLKPGQPYFASANRRRGLKTSHSLIGGMERYLTSAKNQIYHIDDIQTLRGLRNYIADMYGQAHGLESLDTMTEEEAEARVKEVYDSHLSTFAKFLNEQANVLAGKTSLIDRGLEGVIGRRGIQTLNTINTQVAKNMVGFNVSSSLTNFVGAVQGLAKVNKFDAIKAFSQVSFNKMGSIFGKTDGFVENDPAMIRRKGAEKFYRTPVEKVSDKGYILMSTVDDLTSEFLIRAKYNELTRKGMDSEQAHVRAGEWAMRILGDRSLGQQPQLYNSKMLGLVTKFQLEVRNQLDAMFYDTVQEANVSTEDIQNGIARNAKKAAKITSTMVQLAVFQHLFGQAFESVAGYNPTFDIISTLMTLFGFDDDEDSEDTFLDNTEQAFLELLEDLPYSSALTGGRIPIQSALPIAQLVKGKDSYGNEKSRWETLAETAPYYIMPGGYNQIKKTKAGLEMFDEEHPVVGSYTDSGNLRFPIEDTPLNRAQAAVFGQWASANARDYFDNERKPLKEKQIEEYAALNIPIQEYWDYREGLTEQETLEDKFDYIAGLDLPVEKKNIMINNVVDRKEAVDLTGYEDFSGYEEFDWAIKNPEKYEFLQSINVSYADYSGSEETKAAYDWAYKNPEKYVVSKAVGGVVEYRQYAKELNEITADKDENGKSISGSRKEKVINYVNNMDADYGTKLILFKSEYTSDDTYNEDIIEYLNNREDISYSEMETILTELGFTVEADGTVRWE